MSEKLIGTSSLFRIGTSVPNSMAGLFIYQEFELALVCELAQLRLMGMPLGLQVLYVV